MTKENKIIPLMLLQHSDSAFPSGAVSFSWGLETLVNRGIVTKADDVQAFLYAQLTARWASLDRIMLVHAHQSWSDPDRIAWLDTLLEAQSLSAEQRQGSRQMGTAMLQMHCKLGTKRAKELSAAISKGKLYGHVSVVQGVLWRALNFDSYQAQSMAAHGLSTAVLSAAVRLSVIGHEDAQRIHSVLLPAVAAALQKSVSEPEEAHSFAPQIEIASMMHEMDEMRLFMN